MDDLKFCGKSKQQLNTLVNLLNIFSEGIGMEQGISKCSIMKIRR